MNSSGPQRLPNQLIAKILLNLPPEERTPPVLLQWRAQGRALKDLVESEPFWNLFSAKAAALPGQSRCEAFIKRMGERTRPGNEYLMRIYRQTTAEFLESDENRECIRKLGADPDLQAAETLMHMRLRNTGKAVRKDAAIISHFLAKGCGMVKEDMTAEEIDDVAAFCKELIHVPSRYWTQAVARELISTFGRHPQNLAANTQALGNIPPYLWRNEQIVRDISDVPGVWAFFGPAFTRRPQFAEELFDQFINDHQIARSDMTSTPTSALLLELWESLPTQLQKDKRRLHQLITLPTREKSVSHDFAPYITEDRQLRRLITAKPHILGDLFNFRAYTSAHNLREEAEAFLNRAKNDDALLRFTIKQLRAAGDTESLDKFCSELLRGPLRQRLISDGLIPGPHVNQASPFTDREDIIMRDWTR